MALASLATVADLSARNITGTPAELALSIASAAIRDAAGALISQDTSTVVVNAGRGNLLTLPGPVTAVASVAVAGSTVTDYEILPNGLWRARGWGSAPARVVVTYTHGLAAVPADIVDLTCTLAKAWLDHTAAGSASTSGLKSVRLDDAAETYTDEQAGALSATHIPAVTRAWLASRFGSAIAVVETL